MGEGFISVMHNSVYYSRIDKNEFPRIVQKWFYTVHEFSKMNLNCLKLFFGYSKMSVNYLEINGKKLRGEKLLFTSSRL